MTSRISISLPDDVIEKLQEHKTDINVSGICRAALEHELEIRELVQSATAREKMIRKLRHQKREFMKECFDEGRKFAKDQIEHLSYEDFITLSVGYDKIDQDWFKERFDGFFDQVLKDISDVIPRFDETAFIQGWVSGVNDFFKRINPKL